MPPQLDPEEEEFAAWATGYHAEQAASEEVHWAAVVAALRAELARVGGPRQEEAQEWCEKHLQILRLSDPEEIARTAVAAWLKTQN